MTNHAVAASFSQGEVEELATFWQRELKISDWDVEVRVVRARELGPDDDGYCTFEETRREALILLRDPRDVNKDRLKPYDQEVTLVHELLHCALAPFTGKQVGDHEDVIQEQAVHAHSQVLVRWKRLAQQFALPGMCGPLAASGEGSTLRASRGNATSSQKRGKR